MDDMTAEERAEKLFAELDGQHGVEVTIAIAEVIRQAELAARAKTFREIAEFVDGEAPKWQACAPAVSCIAAQIRIRAPRGQ